MTDEAGVPLFAVSGTPPEPLSFTGHGREYFRIWIVNLALTVVTLGIYSAWAKVRRLQYFYRHTRLAGSGFDYHGNPMAILKGRIIALGLLVGYWMTGLVRPAFAAVILAVIAGIMPWLLNRSFRFRFHNSSYRGLRFRFHGSVAEAYKVFLALPLLTVFTLGLLAPFTHQRLKQYQHGNAAFGRTRFTFSAPVSEFYLFYLAAAALWIVVVGFLVGVVTVGMLVSHASGGGEMSPPSPVFVAAGFIAFAAVYVPALIGVQAFILSRAQNLVWQFTQLDRYQFACTLQARVLFWIMLTNLLATAVTLGFYRPFAVVRQARYMASAFTLIPGGNLQEFIADEESDVSATGEEAAELFDIDIAF